MLAWYSSGVGEEVVCVQVVVAQELKSIAVVFVVPRLGDHIDDVPGTETVLRGEAVALEAEFLSLFDAGNVHNSPPLAVNVPMPVEEELCIAESTSAEVEEGYVLIGVGLMCARATGPLRQSRVGDCRVQENETEDVSLIERKIQHGLLVDLRGNVRV